MTWAWGEHKQYTYMGTLKYLGAGAVTANLNIRFFESSGYTCIRRLTGGGGRGRQQGVRWDVTVHYIVCLVVI